MTPFALAPAIAAILNVVLVIWVFLQAPRGRVRRTFLAWNIILALWNIGISVGYTITDSREALLWYRYMVTPVVRFIAPCFLHFVMAITDAGNARRNRWALGLAYGAALLWLVLGVTMPGFIDQVNHFYWGFYPRASLGEALFGIPFFATVLYALHLLNLSMRRATGADRQHMKYLLIGAVIYYTGGATNFLSLYGISCYPTGNLMNSLYSLFVAYAIAEHGFMDIQVMLRRSTVYALLSGSMSAVYLSLVALLEKLFGYYGMQERVVFHTAAFPLTVLLAPTMKSRIEPFVDHAIFGGCVHTHPVPSTARHEDMALMGVLATEMAHELAKPLTHIMNAGSRLQHAVKDSSQENLKLIEKEVQRASEILDGFAMLAPERKLVRMSVPMADLVEESLNTLGIEDDPQIDISREFAPLPPVSVNPGQIVQILTNLIQNAWQAMPTGGTLTLTLRGIKEAEEYSDIEVGVTDTGIGIPFPLQHKVFDPFFTTKQSRGGRGMGLTISRAMAERHGGTIRLKSPAANERGTQAILTLPIIRNEESNDAL